MPSASPLQSAAAPGEEFRDDVRVARHSASDLRRLLSSDQLAQLTALAPLRSTLAVLVTLASLALAIGRVRAICEHGAVTDLSSPLTAARTNRPGWLARFALFPHHVDYHVEHHLYPAVPHYRLPELHRVLAGHGVLAGAEVRRVADTFGLIFADRAAPTA